MWWPNFAGEFESEPRSEFRAWNEELNVGARCFIEVVLACLPPAVRFVFFSLVGALGDKCSATSGCVIPTELLLRVTVDEQDVDGILLATVIHFH